MLSEDYMLILKSLVNCIIPADDYPDGWSAGVGDYLINQFEGGLKDKLETYKSGLSAIDEEARAVYEQSFAELSAEQQNQLLTQIEAGQIKSTAENLPLFFVMVIEHATEGFYSNPENGGNRDGIAWDMMGFEVTQ